MAIALVAACGVANAQTTLKDILSSTAVQEVVSSVTGVNVSQYITSDITGTWSYEGMASELSSGSDDSLTSALTSTVSSSALSSVNKKLDSALSKIGITEGCMTYTFASDSTFTHAVNKISLSGTYSLNGTRLTMKYGKTLSYASVSGDIDLEGDTLKILFDADEFIDLLGKITSSSSKLSSVSSAISKIDGLAIGVSLGKSDSTTE